ncbi:hypothetical protein R3P38DRAFT_2545004 [Favolaschia claudopus]|uniref:F-box domain-containing protein n=1 Tax=Favolaschia claudopus TaxID=2862362 RepID=A0AAW0AN54_9AGAR
MHRCWNVPELTLTILNNIDDHNGPPAPDAVELHQPLRRSQTLASLAQTCRKLSSPALNLLWAAQHDYVPLLSRLPAGTWELDDGHFNIVRPLRVEDWQRVFAYSGRINEFLDTGDGPKLDSSVSDAMLASLPPRPLLPKVRLVFCRSSSPLFSHLPTLLGARVSAIRIDLEVEDSWCFPAVRQMASRFPSLERIQIDGNCTTNADLEWGGACVTQLHDLRLITVRALNSNTYRHISGLKRLESLTIRSLSAHKFVFQPRDNLTPSLRFSALRKLVIGADALDSICTFLPDVCQAPLERVCISATELLSSSISARYLMEGIATNCSPSHMMSIRLTLKAVQGATFRFTSEDIRPVLNLPNLKHVQLCIPTVCSMDDNFVQEMAIAWPALEELSIFCSYRPSDSPTPLALVSLACYCPHLHHVGLNVDATRIPLFVVPPIPRQIQCAVVRWTVGFSSIEQPDAVAKLLSAFVPAWKI